METIHRYWWLVLGLAGMLGTLMRISYQLGGIRQEFSDHLKSSHEAHTSIWRELGWLRDRRR